MRRIKCPPESEPSHFRYRERESWWYEPAFLIHGISLQRDDVWPQISDGVDAEFHLMIRHRECRAIVVFCFIDDPCIPWSFLILILILILIRARFRLRVECGQCQDGRVLRTTVSGP